MAKDTKISGATADAPFGYKADGTPRKRAGASGPRVSKPLHVVFQATDQTGAPIQGAKLNVLYAGKDVEQVMEMMDANPGAQRTKVQVSASASEQ